MSLISVNIWTPLTGKLTAHCLKFKHFPQYIFGNRLIIIYYVNSKLFEVYIIFLVDPVSNTTVCSMKQNQVKINVDGGNLVMSETWYLSEVGRHRLKMVESDIFYFFLNEEIFI